MLNIRPYNNKELLLFPASVGDYLSNDHLVYVVDEAVEQIDLTPYYRKIFPVGNTSYQVVQQLHLRLKSGVKMSRCIFWGIFLKKQFFNTICGVNFFFKKREF